jgi:predicted XRE-type DNA-binding protein
MDAAKRQSLEEAGFQVGTVAEFLGLTPEENELVEIKVALSAALRKQRGVRQLSQMQLAEKIGSSQSRVAKMEAGASHASLDLLVKALVASGMTRQELAAVIAA